VLTPFERNVATTEYAFSAPLKSHIVFNRCLVFSPVFNMLSVATALSLSSTQREAIQSYVQFPFWNIYYLILELQVLVPSVYLHGSGMCGHADASLIDVHGSSAPWAASVPSMGMSFVVLLVLLLLSGL
jgi:hypothetical protein